MVVGPAASATVTSSVSQGVLTVTGDDNDDSIAIGCAGHDVTVNGAPPLSGVAACADITGIVADGGGGSDVLTLRAVSAVDYSSLQSITVRGGEGADTLLGSSFDETLLGGPGDDVLDPGGGTDDSVDGGPGWDEIQAVADPDLVLTDDDLSGTGVAASLRDVESASLEGGSGPDSIDASGFSGATVLRSLGGADVVIGGSSADAIVGSGGDDSLRGGPGEDLIRGGDGNDQLRGGDGDDEIRGGHGTDTCRGGPGHDRLSGCE